MPVKILNYLGADYGISGAGESSIIKLLDNLQAGKPVPKIINGYTDLKSNYFDLKRMKLIDYTSYLKNGGIVGFRTQIGCMGDCMFCTEAKKRVIYHTPEVVGNELSMLKLKGCTDFHLCDSEFNQNLEHCLEVCKAIEKSTGGINWSLYMKPEPFSEDLFFWLVKSGARMLTLSLNTQHTSNHSLKTISDFLSLAFRFNIKIAIDLSTGFPFEEISDAYKMIDFLEKQPVETVGINSYYRVYPGTSLHHEIQENENLNKYLIKPYADETFVRPVFFNWFDLSTLKQLTKSRKKFRIEGFDQATNYQRISNT